MCTTRSYHGKLHLNFIIRWFRASILWMNMHNLFDCREYLKPTSRITLAKLSRTIPVREEISNKSPFYIKFLAQKFNIYLTWIWHWFVFIRGKFQVPEKRGHMRKKKEGGRKLQLDDCRCRVTKRWRNGEEQKVERKIPDWGISMSSPNGRMMTLLHLPLDPPTLVVVCSAIPPPIWKNAWMRSNAQLSGRRTGFWMLGFSSHVHLVANYTARGCGGECSIPVRSQNGLLDLHDPEAW